MKGEYNIVISTSRVAYSVTINRQVTTLIGNSGSGKTDFFRCCEALMNGIPNYKASQDVRDRVLAVRSVGEFREYSKLSGKIIVVDENNPVIRDTMVLTDCIFGSDNYYILITRDYLSGIDHAMLRFSRSVDCGRAVNISEQVIVQ